MSAKIIETFWLFWAYHHKGINDAIFGSTLLDLEMLLKTDLASLSHIFLANGLGSVGGSALSSVFVNRYSIHLLLGIQLIVGCAVTMAIPQIPVLLYAYIMVLVYGMTRGAVECHVIQACSALWTEKGVPFQFVITGSSMGSILVPLLCQPFLASRMDLINQTQLLPEMILAPNNSLVNGFVLSNDGVDIIAYGTTHVKWVYFLLAIFILPSGIAQFYYWFKEQKSEDPIAQSYTELTISEVPKLSRVALFICTLVMFLLIGASSVFQMSMLPVYGVYSSLHMPKRFMIAMVTAISVGSLLMRVLSSIALKFITNSALLKICLTGEVLGGVFLVLSARYSSPSYLWIATAMMGGAAGPLAGATFARISEFLPLNAAIIAGSFVAASIGVAIFPCLGGLLFSMYGPVTYLYVNLSVIAGHCIMLILIEVFGRIYVHYKN